MRKSTTWEPLQHTRTEHSGRVQQQVKFKTTSTKFQEHATNKHVMILSCKGVSYGIAISQTLFTAPSLDHRCTLVQVTYNTFKSSITSCKNIPKRSSEKLSTSWTAQPWQLWKLLHTSSNESTCVQLYASDIKLVRSETVMPERLLSVISGILAGGSLVSALSFVASITLLPGPFVCFRVFFVLLLVRWPFSMTHKMSSCMLFPLLVAIPLLCVFVCFGLVVVVCFWFAWFLLFWVWFFGSCWDSSLDCVQVHYQYFCGYRQVDSLAW